MTNPWIAHTNEKLYYARLMFEQSIRPEFADKAPQRESARQAGLYFMHQGWLGLLNEIGHAFKLKTEISSLSDLENRLGVATSEVAALMSLYEQPQSWMRLLLKEYEILNRPQPKGTGPVQSSEGLISVQSDEDSSGKYLLMLQDLKEYVSAFRDRAYEW